MPALMLASGPIVVPAPISMRPSPKITVGGKPIIAPSPKCANFRARRWRGPIAPNRAAVAPRRVDRHRPPRARPRPAAHGERYGVAFTRHGQRRDPDPDRLAVRLPAGRRPVRRRRCGSGSTKSRRSGRLDREIEFVEQHARGLPSGSEHDIKRAFAELDDDGAIAIIGPSISDNALIAAPLCDAARIPAINYSGGERTRSQWMFHYQVGSLEEEPPVLAARMVERGLRRAAVVFDQSPVGRRYAECFEAARARLGLEVTGTASISSLAEIGRRHPRAAARRQPRRARVPRARRVVARGRGRARRRSAGTCPCSRTPR